MRILDPTIQQKATKRTVPMASRPQSLSGATIGLLANSKSNSMALLDRLAEILSDRYQIGNVVRISKGDLKAPMSRVDADRLVGSCTAVITAIGD